jgi:hypothetical protein
MSAEDDRGKALIVKNGYTGSPVTTATAIDSFEDVRVYSDSTFYPVQSAKHVYPRTYFSLCEWNTVAYQITTTLQKNVIPLADDRAEIWSTLFPGSPMPLSRENVVESNFGILDREIKRPIDPKDFETLLRRSRRLT